MKKIILFIGIILCSGLSFGALTITAPVSVDGDYNVQKSVSVQLTSDSEDEITRIRLIGGITSTDVDSCIKDYEAAESCSFSVEHTVLNKLTTRVYVYTKNSGRSFHTMTFDVDETSVRADLTAGITFAGKNVSGNNLDLGNLGIISTTQTRVYIKNSGNQRTAALDSMVANYTGSTSYLIVRDGCQGKELDANETCYIDVRILLSSVIEGTQSGTVLVKAAGEATGTTLNITGELTLGSSGSGGGQDIVVNSGEPTGNGQVRSREYAQSFLVENNALLDEMDLFLGKNHPTEPIVSGEVKVEIGIIDPSLVGGSPGDNYPVFNGTYPGIIIGESASLDLVALDLSGTDQERITFVFPSIALSAGTEYFFVLTHSAIDNIGSDRLRAGYLNAVNPVEGSKLFRSGSSWYKLGTYTGSSNQEDLPYSLRATGN